MSKRKRSLVPLSDFLQYLAKSNGNGPALPSLTVIGEELGASVASVREQLAVARALGWVEVKPRTGIRRLSYSFYPTVRHSVSYAIELDEAYFKQFSSLRNHLEAAYWLEAVRLLSDEDKADLRILLTQAIEKLERSPVQIPHREHRNLHLSIYKRLENTFVMGIFEAYWDLYEAMGFDVFADYQYLKHIWQYHEQMVNSICEGRYQQGFDALIEHKDLLYQRPEPQSRQKFE